MPDFSNKYGNQARNLWRKVYGYRNHKPNETSIVDADTSVTYSIDRSKTVRHRDYYIINGYVGATIEIPGPIILAEYDEGLIAVNGTDSGIQGFFNFAFSSLPYVVLTVESASINGENVQIYGSTFDTLGFIFGLSAPFSGTVRYRAIYSPTYPAYVTSSYTASITASAGNAVVTGQHSYTASYDALPGTPFRFLQTSWNDSGDLGNDVAFSTQTTGSSTATVELSSELSSDINFIAFYE